MPITIFPPIPIIATATISGVVQTALPPNAAQELNGQVQRVADTMESVLIELRVISNAIAQLNDGTPIDPDQIRADASLLAQ